MSLKQIAELTGVSPATVSRVLNNPDYHCQDRAVTEKSGKQPENRAMFLTAAQGNLKKVLYILIMYLK